MDWLTVSPSIVLHVAGGFLLGWLFRSLLLRFQQYKDTTLSLPVSSQDIQTRPNSGKIPSKSVLAPVKGIADIETAVAPRTRQQPATSPATSATPFMLTGNFASVKETDLHDIPFTGTLPPYLSGAFLRTGPNPDRMPDKYNWFDGDGMIHTMRIQNGKLSYSNRYVQTSRLQQNRKYEKDRIPGLGAQRGMSGFMALGKFEMECKEGKFDLSEAMNNFLGPANTNMAIHAGKLLALNEQDAPYQVKLMLEGAVETLAWLGTASDGFGGPAAPCTAHPKVCSRTGEMVFFGYDCQKQPHLTVSVQDPGGQLVRSVGVRLRHPCMVHDFAITPNFAILQDHSFYFKMSNMVAHPVKGYPFVWDEAATLRLGLLPRTAAGQALIGQASLDEVEWFDTGRAGFVLHTAGASEAHLVAQDGSCQTVVTMFGTQFTFFDLSMTEDPAPWTAREMASLMKYEINLTTKQVTVTDLFPHLRQHLVALDFPIISRWEVGSVGPPRYCWIARLRTPFQKADPGVAHGQIFGWYKLDLAAAAPAEMIVGQIDLPASTYGGELVFVPASSTLQGQRGPDDGCLVTFVHDEATNASSFRVWDAATMKPLATAAMSVRVPYGMHAMWMTEEDIASQ